MMYAPSILWGIFWIRVGCYWEFEILGIRASMQGGTKVYFGHEMPAGESQGEKKRARGKRMGLNCD